MADISFSDEQNKALKSVLEWFRGPNPKQVFRLMGYAGTGKTTIAKTIAEEIGKGVLFGAFTGKAALVMRNKGCKGASTIHSLIYKPVEDEHGLVTYVRNNESLIRDASLIIIDECSMVGKELGEDLLSFGVPVLVLGDPAQLPPVASEGFFTKDEPDVMLTEIHRQALENPIIVLSMAARNHIDLEEGTYGNSRIIKHANFNPEEMVDMDQILCGMNKTRIVANERMRDMLGFKGSFPEEGERLVCLKNDRKKGLLNGGLWNVLSIKQRYANSTAFIVKPTDVKGNPVQVYVHDNFFNGTESDLDWQKRKRYNEFTWGYTLTVHKGQGSEWDNLLLFDESDAFRDDKYRWLYTGITRAAEKLTIII